MAFGASARKPVDFASNVSPFMALILCVPFHIDRDSSFRFFFRAFFSVRREIGHFARQRASVYRWVIIHAKHAIYGPNAPDWFRIEFDCAYTRVARYREIVFWSEKVFHGDMSTDWCRRRYTRWILDAPRTLIECIVAMQTWEINFVSHISNRRPYHSRVAAFILLIIKYYYFHRMFRHSSETRDNRAECESLHNFSRVHGFANSWLCNVQCQGRMQFSIISFFVVVVPLLRLLLLLFPFLVT